MSYLENVGSSSKSNLTINEATFVGSRLFKRKQNNTENVFADPVVMAGGAGDCSFMFGKHLKVFL